MAASTASQQVRMIPLELIDAGDNDRQHFDAAELAELAESIRTNGLAQPVTLRPKAGRYELVCGERRTRACRLLGRDSIEAIVRPLTDRQADDIMLVENTSRSDLDPIDEARGYQKRMDKYGLTTAEVARIAGVSAQQVSLRLKLLRLTPEAQFLTSKGGLPIGFAPMLATLDGNRQALALAAWKQASGGLNWWQWDSLCKRLQAEQDQDSMFDAESFMQVEEFVLTAQQSKTPTASLRKLVAKMADALEAAGAAPELVVQARSAVPAATAAA